MPSLLHLWKRRVSAPSLCYWAALSWERGNRWQFNRKLIALCGVRQGLSSGDLGEKFSACHTSLEKELAVAGFLPPTSVLGGAWVGGVMGFHCLLEAPSAGTPLRSQKLWPQSRGGSVCVCVCVCVCWEKGWDGESWVRKWQWSMCPDLEWLCLSRCSCRAWLLLGLGSRV